MGFKIRIVRDDSLDKKAPPEVDEAAENVEESAKDETELAAKGGIFSDWTAKEKIAAALAAITVIGGVAASHSGSHDTQPAQQSTIQNTP